MRIKALLAAAAITALTGSAIAQTTDSTGTNQGEPASAEWGSAQEEQMFQENRETWGGFFMDENFTELAPEDDMRANWDAMSAEDQDEARAVCEQVQGAPTEYRNVTVQWCENIGLL